MTWVKLDDGFDEHPAMERLTDGAIRMLVCSWSFCGRNLTDGFIPEVRVLRLTPTAKQKYVDELVREGRWEKVDGGYLVPSFLDFNPSREKVLSDREQGRVRQKKFRDSQRSNGVTNGEVNLPRPDPTRSIESFTDFSNPSTEPVDKAVVEDSLAVARSSLHQLRGVS